MDDQEVRRKRWSVHAVEDDRVLSVIELPARRVVRWADYVPSVPGAWLASSRWPDDEPELVNAARTESWFREEIAAQLRNAMWVIRNHRIVAVDAVLQAVRMYASGDRLLELAGVQPLVLACYCEWLLCRCDCNGDCPLWCGRVDLLDLDTWGAGCDHVRLRGREIADTMDQPLFMVLAHLLGPAFREGAGSGSGGGGSTGPASSSQPAG